jgi:hypothetical protein
VVAEVGASRVGLRLSPYNTFLDACDSVPRAVEKNVYLLQQLEDKVPGMAYVHMVSAQRVPPAHFLASPVVHLIVCRHGWLEFCCVA